MLALRIPHQCAITCHCRFGASWRLSLGAVWLRLEVRAHSDSRWPERPKEDSMTRHSKIVISCGALIVAMVAGRSDAPSAAESNAAVQGVWRTVEVVVPGAAARTFKPNATLAIFHGRHYSRVEVHAEQPRPLLGNPADASADQLRAVWGPFVAEAGTFDVSGSDVITMRATVAKNPAAMRDGAASVYKYRREGDRLILTEVRTPAGPSAQPITVKLTRVE
jgi:hypothetical protein